MQKGKNSMFATFGGYLGFLAENKHCKYLQNGNRQSDFERIFDPRVVQQYSVPRGKMSSWILAENEKL